jgi:hypothetical protein
LKCIDASDEEQAMDDDDKRFVGEQLKAFASLLDRQLELNEVLNTRLNHVEVALQQRDDGAAMALAAVVAASEVDHVELSRRLAAAVRECTSTNQPIAAGFLAALAGRLKLQTGANPEDP